MASQDARRRALHPVRQATHGLQEPLQPLRAQAKDRVAPVRLLSAALENGTGQADAGVSLAAARGGE